MSLSKKTFYIFSTGLVSFLLFNVNCKEKCEHDTGDQIKTEETKDKPVKSKKAKKSLGEVEAGS